ncbi:BlaI/MecI/CopY family transcriptional regulator [Streptomyces sp. NPDC052036]|uniref:BlaI/MecI/CopY family transcriptional regulator n=1 Tax=unclassified Streptomyces TaxID=2593676 RepID=UPI003431986C
MRCCGPPAGPLTAGELLRRLGGDLAYGTVATVLSGMHDKGVLTRTEQGRTYAYAPVTDSPGMTARRMYQALESDPDREAVLARFVDKLPATDEELLRQLLRILPDEQR